MTELALPTSDAPVQTLALVATQDDGELPLTGPGPFTVNVTIKGDTAWFTLPTSSTEYSGGVDWKSPKGATPTSITFAFQSPVITQLTSQSAGLSFLPVANRSQSTNPISTAQGDYEFLIWVSGPGGPVRGAIDPVVIVTPIDHL